MATIVKDIPIDIDFNKIKISNNLLKNNNELLEIFEQLEFNKLIKKLFNKENNDSNTKQVIDFSIKQVQTKDNIDNLYSLLDKYRYFSFIFDKSNGHPLYVDIENIVIRFSDEDSYIINKKYIENLDKIFSCNIMKNTYNLKEAFIYFINHITSDIDY